MNTKHNSLKGGRLRTTKYRLLATGGKAALGIGPWALEKKDETRIQVPGEDYGQQATGQNQKPDVRSPKPIPNLFYPLLRHFYRLLSDLTKS